MQANEYADLHKFSKSIGIASDKLIRAFEIERIFHNKILNEPLAIERKKLYSEVYNKVHEIYGKKESNINSTSNPKDGIVKLFKKELENKSILDLGCGEGYFLASAFRKLKTKKLVGLDVSIPSQSLNNKDIKFIKADIIDFRLEEKFDVIFADQVVEHIAPSDLSTFLLSVKNALNNNGTFILMLPNSQFGPSDVTRIKDFSYSGKTEAEGTHLNETTYSDLLQVLKNYGFTNFKTTLPVPKLKRYFSNLRLNPNILALVENNRFLMWLIYHIKYRGLPLFRFGITIICSPN